MSSSSHQADKSSVVAVGRWSLCLAIALGALLSAAVGASVQKPKLAAEISLGRQASCYDGPEAVAERRYLSVRITNTSADLVTLLPESSHWFRTKVTELVPDRPTPRVLWTDTAHYADAFPDPALPPRWPKVVLRPGDSLTLPSDVTLAVLRSPGPTVSGVVRPGSYALELEHAILEEVEGRRVWIRTSIATIVRMTVGEPYSFEYCREDERPAAGSSGR